MAIYTALPKRLRLAGYISAVQVYFQDNFLLERPLLSADTKPRLLGHWGTCPKLNFAYAHLDQVISTRQLDVMFVLGPGHGFSAVPARRLKEDFQHELANHQAHIIVHGDDPESITNWSWQAR